MRNNQLGSMLLGLLILSTLAGIALTIADHHYVLKLQRMQPQLNNGRNLFQSLLNESAEYGKTHPEMAHLLQSHLGGQPQAATTPAPATAPAKPAK